MRVLEAKRTNQRRKRLKHKQSATNQNKPNSNMLSSHCGREDEIIKMFEDEVKQLKHHMCDICQKVSIRLGTTKLSDINACKLCVEQKLQNVDPREMRLPIWVDDNREIRYDSPDKLSVLREGEKLLIQKTSVYIPLLHMRKGQLGCRGHTCAFPQSIEDVVYTLPRVPKDVKSIRVIKNMKKDGENHVKTFVIQWQIVLDALNWLKKYNIQYKDIHIDETNLNWMKGEEDELEVTETIICEETDNDGDEVDKGPSTEQVYDVTADCELQTYSGVLNVKFANVPGAKDKQTTEELQEAVDTAPFKKTIPFPYISPDPINEYDPSKKLFCDAFPWLFPGGFGDYNDFSPRNQHIKDWLENLILYQDGRFAKDPMFSFFALDYATRRKNNTSGNYFVNGFFKNGPKTVHELKKRIKSGDTKWVDK